MASKLPKGTVYWTHFGKVAITEYEGKLIYFWGDKGIKGLNTRPVYYVPVTHGSHTRPVVGEYVSPENILHIPPE